MYQRAFDGEKACAGAESRAALEQWDRMAGAMTKLGHAQQALPMLEQAMPAWRKVAGSSPDLAEPLYFLARAQIETAHYQDAEKSAKELFQVQDGKVSATDRHIGAAHLLWARALAGEHRDQEALPHAETAMKLLSNGVSHDAKQMDSEAQQVLRDIRARLHA